MRVGLLVADPAWEEARAGSAPRDRLLHSMTRQEKTVAAVRAALGALGHTAVDIRVDEGLAGALRAAGVDVVFNTYFGPGTRHDQPAVAAVMEWVGVPFSGGGAACHYVGLSKPLTKRLLVAEGLPTPRFVSGGDAASLRAAGIELPVIVKAPGEGEGIGIDESSVARTDGELAAARERIAREFATEALVEELMPGREVTVGVIEGATPVVLPVLEVMVGQGAVFSWATKAGESVEEVCPAELPARQTALLGDLAVRAGRAVGCRDFWRVDFRQDARGDFRILEVNTLPGLQPGYSDLALMIEPAGMEYGHVVGMILESALRRGRGTG